MRYVLSGRIVLWEGASLWAFDVPPAAQPRRSTDFHTHHAIQLTIAIDGRFEFRIGSEVVDGPTVLIAPDVPHAYEPNGRNAMIFIDPESTIGVEVIRNLMGRDFARLSPETFSDIAAKLSCIWEQPRPDNATLIALGQALATRLAGKPDSPRTIDKRIARVLERLSNDVDTPMDVSKAADIACLSESRFSHLFVAEVRLPFRTYLLWRRLMVAVNGIASGSSLTSAAHDAGFADSAHFSRTFLKMFGVPASLLQMI